MGCRRPSSQRDTRVTTKRLLIANGHSSHVNLWLVEWASKYGVIILMPTQHQKISMSSYSLKNDQLLGKHLQSGLQETLKNKKEERGKRLDLVREVGSGAQVFYSSMHGLMKAEKEAAEEAGKEAKKVFFFFFFFFFSSGGG